MKSLLYSSVFFAFLSLVPLRRFEVGRALLETYGTLHTKSANQDSAQSKLNRLIKFLLSKKVAPSVFMFQRSFQGL